MCRLDRDGRSVRDAQVAFQRGGAGYPTAPTGSNDSAAQVRSPFRYRIPHTDNHLVPISSVFKVLQYWLSSRQIPVNGQLLLQMRVFCEEAVRTKVSPTMVERAAGLLDLINERVRFPLHPTLLL